MSVLPVAALSAAPLNLGTDIQAAALPQGGPAGIETVFDSLVSQLQSLNDSLSRSAPAVNAMALGDSDQLESVLLEMERVRVQFDFMMSVRNRLLESYQEIMRMQV